MSRSSDPASTRWIELSPTPQVVMALADPILCVVHFDREVDRSRRCGGRRCALCAVGLPKLSQWVTLVVDSEGCDRLFAFRSRHQAELEHWQALHRTLCGVVFRVWKGGLNRNAPIEVERLGYEVAYRREISRLVESLYLPARLLPPTDAADDLDARLSAVAARLTLSEEVTP